MRLLYGISENKKSFNLKNIEVFPLEAEGFTKRDNYVRTYNPHDFLSQYAFNEEFKRNNFS